MTPAKKFLPTDKVNLIYLMKSGINVTTGVSLRSEAMKQIRNWWLLRQEVLAGTPSAIHFMDKGTFAGGNRPNDSELSENMSDHYAFAWSEIVGMYIREIDEEAEDLERERINAQKEYNAALRLQAETMKRQIDHCESHQVVEGDEWKNPDEEDDEDEDVEDPDDPEHVR